MQQVNLRRLGLIIALLLCGGVATADSIRCNGQIIEDGVSQATVSEYCGSPDEIVTETDYIWIYKNRPGGQEWRIYFYANGDVLKIEVARE